MNKAQEEEITRWTYLVEGITEKHAKDWHSQLLREGKREEADLFKRRVNWINKKKVLI